MSTSRRPLVRNKNRCRQLPQIDFDMIVRQIDETSAIAGVIERKYRAVEAGLIHRTNSPVRLAVISKHQANLLAFPKQTRLQPPSA